MINLILLPLRLEQMGKVQELAGLPALKWEIHDVHKVDSTCKVAYIHTDMHTQTYNYVESRENKKIWKKLKIILFKLLFSFQNKNILFAIT